jgi:hypothetical protein
VLYQQFKFKGVHMTKQFFSLGTGVLTAMLIGLAGCGGSSDTSTASGDTLASSDGLGQVRVLLTDDPASFQAVYVTIDTIQVKKRDGNDSDSNESNKWMTVAEPYKTYDLLTLQNGVTAELGETNISVGTYSELRLNLGEQEDNGTNLLGGSHPYANYIVFIGDDVAELKVPSSTLKQKYDFNVDETGIIEMTIDFDANRSIHMSGNSGQWILTPVLGITNKHLGTTESEEAEAADEVDETEAFDEFEEFDEFAEPEETEEPEAESPDDEEDAETDGVEDDASEPADDGDTPDSIA